MEHYLKLPLHLALSPLWVWFMLLLEEDEELTGQLEELWFLQQSRCSWGLWAGISNHNVESHTGVWEASVFWWRFLRKKMSLLSHIPFVPFPGFAIRKCMLDLVSKQRCGHSLLCVLNAGLPGLLDSMDYFKLKLTSGLRFFSVLSAGQAEYKSLAESWHLGTASWVERLGISMF